MIRWILQPENGALLALLSAIAGAIGLCFTVYSLIVALKQLKAIRSETEAANEAIALVKFKIENFDAAKECQIALSQISRIRISLRKADLGEMLDAYEELIQTFIRLRHSGSDHVVGNSSRLDQASGLMAKICDGIRKRLDAEGDQRPIRGQDLALRDFSDLITEISFAASRDLQK